MKLLKQIFSSLISNKPVMEGRHYPWYVALALFLVSVIVASYPTFTQINNRQGSDFLRGSNYSVDVGLQAFSEALIDEDVRLIIRDVTVEATSTRQLVNELNTFSSVFTDVIEPGSTFTHFTFTTSTNEVRLRVFYQGDHTDEETDAFRNDLLSLPIGSPLISSFMLLGTTRAYVYVYNPASIRAGTIDGSGFAKGFTGSYDLVTLNTSLGNFVEPSLRNPQNYATYEQLLMDAWKQFFDQSFAFSKSFLLWAQTGLTLVVNTIMAAMMTFIIFVMTRGKNNPNRDLKFKDTLKIGAWALLSPALLTIVAGGLFPEFAPTAFVLFVGLRLMWLSSKYLRPLDPLPVKK